MPPLTPAQRRLYGAALPLFAERGTTQVNVSEMAQAAGVARGTVYDNLSDLDGLLFEVAAQLGNERADRRHGEGNGRCGRQAGQRHRFLHQARMRSRTGGV